MSNHGSPGASSLHSPVALSDLQLEGVPHAALSLPESTKVITAVPAVPLCPVPSASLSPSGSAAPDGLSVAHPELRREGPDCSVAMPCWSPLSHAHCVAGCGAEFCAGSGSSPWVWFDIGHMIKCLLWNYVNLDMVTTFNDT